MSYDFEALVAEVAHLRAQRDELQRANTRLLEETRQAKQDLRCERAARRFVEAREYRAHLRAVELEKALTFAVRKNDLPFDRYPDRFLSFFEMVNRKFNARGHKGDWRGQPIEHFLRCLEWETAELKKAISEGEDVRTECADVAITALILDDLHTQM